MATVLHDYVFKYIVIGDVAVGKSCVLFQFTDSLFMQDCEPTVCVEFNSKIVQVNGKRFKLQVWDTSGQDRFRDVTRSHYRGSACIFLMYDVTRRSTFEHIKGWLRDAIAASTPGTVLVLMGNKSEPGSPREVTTEEGQAFANQEGMLFFEVSAKTGHNVQNAFLEATKKVYENAESGESPVMRIQDSPLTSDSLLDKPRNGLGQKMSTEIGSLEMAYAKLSLFSLFCVGRTSQKRPSRMSVKLCVLPWQILGRTLVFCFFMFLELALILPCMFLILVQRPRQANSSQKPQSLNDSTDSVSPEPDEPISLPLFIVKSTLSLLFLLVYPLIAIYYIVPIYIIKQYPAELIQILVALQIFVLTILLLFGIVRRLQKRKYTLDLTRSGQIELSKVEGKFQWKNLGNWIVIGILVLEWLQVVGFPLQSLSSGSAKFFAAFYLYFKNGSGTLAIFWMSIIVVFLLFAIINVQILADLRKYISLKQQGKLEEASASFYFSFFGSVIFGHGKPENINKFVRYAVMITTDGLFFILISQLLSIFACEYIVITAENHGVLVENKDVVCWTSSHYTMVFFSYLFLGYYTLFSGLVSPILVESGISTDIHFHGIYTSAINVVKLVFLYSTLLFSPFTPLYYTLASLLAGVVLLCVTVAWMLLTSIRMRQPSVSAGANVFRAWTFASWFVAGLLTYAGVKGELTEGTRTFIAVGGLVAVLGAAVAWYMWYRKKGGNYREFSKMPNSEILIEEGSEMDQL